MIKYHIFKRLIGISLAILYLSYRVSNVFLVIPFFDEYDSPAYFEWNIYPSFRTHGITFIYSIIENEFIITLIQSIIGSLVWIYLWFVVISIIKNNIIQLVFTLLFYALGSSSILIEQDSSLLSESLSISATLFLIGVSINFFIIKNNPSNLDFAVLGFAIIWFASTKSSNSIIAPFILAIYLLTLRFQKKNKLKFIVVSSISVLVTFFFVNALSSDVTKTLTTSGTINNRLIYNEKWKNELIKSGYPVLAFKTFENHSEKNLGIPPDQAVVNLTQFKEWWNKGGDSFLLKFTLANPDYAFIAPIALPLFSEEFNFRKSLLSGWSQGTDRTEGYFGFENSLSPRTFFWPDEPEKAYLVLAISFAVMGLSLYLLTFLNKYREFYLFVLIILSAIMWSYLNWWFGSKPSDMARHNLIAAIVFKVLPLIMLSISLDYLFRLKNMLNLKFTGVRTSSD